MFPARYHAQMGYALGIAATSFLAVALYCAALNLVAAGHNFIAGCTRCGALVVGAMSWLMLLQIFRDAVQ